MNKRILTIACLIILCALTVGFIQTSHGPRWDYDVVDRQSAAYKSEDVRKTLERQGQLGWELVAVQGDVFYFKRLR